MIVRHAEPDYTLDSLTPKGHREAELLSHRLAAVDDVLDYYVSPKGRAMATAGYTLRKVGREGEIMPWLVEFRGTCLDPDKGVVRYSNVQTIWQETCDGVDGIMARYGYVKDGPVWHAEENRKGTIMLFCHFAVGMAVTAYLTHMSPMLLWHGLFMAPSSVTTLISEERREHEVAWRCLQVGDISHLNAASEPYSTAGLFAECYDGRDSSSPVEWEKPKRQP